MEFALQHLVFFQHGDFGAGYRRFSEGLPETYRDQKRSVEFVAALANRYRVTTIAICNRPHREKLSENLWSIGINIRTAYSPRRLLPLLNDLNPTLFICRTPHLAALLWARWRHLPTLPCFADIFSANDIRSAAKNHLLRFALSGPNVPCVANHSRNASLSLAHVLHLPETRSVPWDWSHLDVASQAKSEPADPMMHTAFFAGVLSAPKGVGDCLRASALLRDQGLYLSINFAGAGDPAPWLGEAERLGIADRIRFVGLLAHASVREQMRKADIVLVPSRHDYAEGMPNTIYEALAARSALVLSDHPAFAGRLRPAEDCMIFRAADPEDLAAQIAKLMRDPDLLLTLSQNAAAAHEALYFGIEWFTLMDLFLDDPSDKTGWVSRHSLRTLRDSNLRRPRTSSLSEDV
ncbi:glycosyltransferase [bacterium]|nr:glycosyltransferase [bacterium]